MIIEISLMCITSIIIAYMFRPVRPAKIKAQMPEDLYYPIADDRPLPASFDINILSDEEVEDFNSYNGLGSDYLIEINEEFDERIKAIEAELEYEMNEKRKVREAQDAIITPEDAKILSKKLIAKNKEEVAE